MLSAKCKHPTITRAYLTSQANGAVVLLLCSCVCSCATQKEEGDGVNGVHAQAQAQGSRFKVKWAGDVHRDLLPEGLLCFHTGFLDAAWSLLYVFRIHEEVARVCDTEHVCRWIGRLCQIYYRLQW